jgi:hypothetical protein
MISMPPAVALSPTGPWLLSARVSGSFSRAQPVTRLAHANHKYRY